MMSVQFGGLARLTWWEYSWDIMEPVTYFVTYGTTMTWFIYYLVTKQVGLTRLRRTQDFLSFRDYKFILLYFAVSLAGVYAARRAEQTSSHSTSQKSAEGRSRPWPVQLAERSGLRTRDHPKNHTRPFARVQDSTEAEATRQVQLQQLKIAQFLAQSQPQSWKRRF